MNEYSAGRRLRPGVGGDAVNGAGAPDRVVCSGCGQTKAADEFYVIRGPLWHGDWLAQPCADCCRWRVAARLAGDAGRS